MQEKRITRTKAVPLCALYNCLQVSVPRVPLAGGGRHAHTLRELGPLRLNPYTLELISHLSIALGPFRVDSRSRGTPPDLGVPLLLPRRSALRGASSLNSLSLSFQPNGRQRTEIRPHRSGMPRDTCGRRVELSGSLCRPRGTQAR